MSTRGWGYFRTLGSLQQIFCGDFVNLQHPLYVLQCLRTPVLQLLGMPRQATYARCPVMLLGLMSSLVQMLCTAAWEQEPPVAIVKDMVTMAMPKAGQLSYLVQEQLGPVFHNFHGHIDGLIRYGWDRSALPGWVWRSQAHSVSSNEADSNARPSSASSVACARARASWCVQAEGRMVVECCSLIGGDPCCCS